ncbi:MAG: glutamate--tRNA ligase [Pseudomonadota bacterium]|nr:glutamate--tRNA ligase [Rhodobiaceae bacterium]MEC9097941.1 glutamate--tRNA ligase [Pseudomonadota bacterium]
MNNPITRFAPSPSGLLHVGNVRTALLNYLVSKKDNGHFILRIDDTDTERSKDKFINNIQQDLNWLGLNYDEYYQQSERIKLYDEAFELLKNKELVYPCFETPDELDKKRKRLIARRMPPVYDRAALKHTKDEIDSFLESGKKPHWRFKLSNKKITFDDLIRGEVNVDLAAQSDPVLKREDGDYLYNLPSVVDDIEMNITHIIRGEDHITNSGIQIEIFNALDSGIPIFGHNSLLVSESGEPFSKRNSAASINQLREDGIDPNAINSLNASIGSSVDIEAYNSLNLLAQKFEITSLGRAPARYSNDQLYKLNSELLSNYDFEKIISLLGDDKGSFNIEFWDCIKQNISNISEVLEWIRVIDDPININTDIDYEYLNIAQDLLPNEPWNTETWDQWILKIKEKTQRKGKDLFMPIRLALTGKTKGPELNKLILLMGYNKVMERLKRR